MSMTRGCSFSQKTAKKDFRTTVGQQSDNSRTTVGQQADNRRTTGGQQADNSRTTSRTRVFQNNIYIFMKKVK